MLCELGNDASGQFFTPYDVCRCMVEISGGSDPAAENAGFFSVSDPACGAGALLIAFANLCRRKISATTTRCFLWRRILT
jgi:type I restriction-modification system DNA methylase subunit